MSEVYCNMQYVKFFMTCILYSLVINSSFLQSGCKRRLQETNQTDGINEIDGSRIDIDTTPNKYANTIRRRGMKQGQSERTSFSRGRDYVYPVYVTREPDMSIRSPRRSRKENEGTTAKWIRKLKIIAASDPLSFARQPQ